MMKKTNQILVVCAVAMVAFFSSCEKKVKEPSKEEVKQKVTNYEELDDYFCSPAEGFDRPNTTLDYNQVVSMLSEYDATRLAPLEKALGYADSRINTFDFKSLIKYLKYVKKLTKGIKNEKVKITGISFISAAKSNYKNTGKSYQDLIYIPTTTINGKQIPFDPYLSDQRDSLVTFKEALAENGYKWIYDSKKDYEEGVAKDHNYKLPMNKKSSKEAKDGSEKSGAGNYGGLEPPYEER